MPLILAVEPDPLRLAHVTSLTRGRRRTDLLIAESVSAALSAITARVPDVLLVSPRLSPEDRGRLTDCLKRLGPAAAHVRMLTTPAPPPDNVEPPGRPVPGSPPIRPLNSAAVAPPPNDDATESRVQNEWGFFDPDRCGFSALSKLDEAVTDAPETRELALVRVIPY